MCNIRFPNLMVLLWVGGLAGCGAPAQKIRNLNGGRIEVIGHGGSGFQSVVNPRVENSSESIYRALDAEGADGVEVDVRFSSDGVPMLFHDTEMAENTTCHGCISTKPAAEIQTCRFREGTLGNFGSQASVLKLERIVDELSRRRPLPKLYLDLKVLDDCNPALKPEALEYARVIEEVIRRYDAYDWIVFKTGTVSLAAEMVRLNPRVRVLLANHDFGTLVRLAVGLKLFGIILETSRITPAQVAEAHAKGLWVVLYGVKSRESAVSAINLFPDSIHTDRVRVLRAVLDP